MNSPRASSTGTEHNPRKRGRTACTRCKSRKQKCDNEYPNCTNCRKAGVECDKSAVSLESENNPGYIQALEERVAFLEGRLSEFSERKAADDSISSDNATRIIHPISAASQRQTPDNVQIGTSTSTLGEVVGFLSLNPSESPAYIGSSSGLSLAVNLGEMVRATVLTKAFPDSPGSSHQQSSRAGATSTTSTSHPSYKAINLDELLKHRADPPNDEMGSRILNTYTGRVHSRYPFLDRDDLWKLHNDRWNLAKTKPENLTQAQRFGIFRLYMVYAIASTLISLSERYEYTAPEKFYMTAIQHVAAACETRSVQNIEAMLLLVIYHLRSATSHGLWYMIGLAMRTCIDLGLHRKSSATQLDPYKVQLRRRLFWTVYYLERAIALSLGRPVSISDRHIDIDLPLDVDDNIRDATILVAEQSQPNTTKLTTLSLFRALLRIRQIDSRIQNTIYRADRPLQELRPKLDKIYRLLEGWKASVVGEYGHSFLAVQTVFVSGITMLYALWGNTDKVWSVRMSNDIRACSTILFAMTERAPWVKRYRDTFELLVNAAMEKLQGNEAAKTSGMAGMMAAQGYGNTMSNTNLNMYPTAPTIPMMAGTTVVQPSMSESAPDFPELPNFASQEQQQPQVQFNFDISEEAVRMAMELAPWIDQELDGEGATTTPLWMPDFDTLQNLTSPYQY
ncbi:Transcription factor [Penicillium occitanis (nom. inval.)]|nr:Transcription factor [Penicillium occitanis (nom. inval.)]PCH08774.1 hypothetical protein PENOC_012920 [Penicillium occitanis (nom. inval.)]